MTRHKYKYIYIYIYISVCNRFQAMLGALKCKQTHFVIFSKLFKIKNCLKYSFFLLILIFFSKGIIFDCNYESVQFIIQKKGLFLRIEIKRNFIFSFMSVLGLTLLQMCVCVCV